VAIPVQLQSQYKFSKYHVGLSFLAIFVGSVVGLVILRVCDMKFAQPVEQERRKQTSDRRLFHPRERLYGTMLGVILQLVSMIWYVYLTQFSIHPDIDS
jgi:hypothetical protein